MYSRQSADALAWHERDNKDRSSLAKILFGGGTESLCASASKALYISLTLPRVLMVETVTVQLCPPRVQHALVCAYMCTHNISAVVRKAEESPGFTLCCTALILNVY